MAAFTETTTPEVQKLIKRFKSTYRVSRIITAIGFVVIALGGIAIFTLPVMHEAHGIMRTMDKGFADVLILFGYVLGLMLAGSGVLIWAQGRILLSNLDSAVNSSPFLTNDIRAELLSLR